MTMCFWSPMCTLSDCWFIFSMHASFNQWNMKHFKTSKQWFIRLENYNQIFNGLKKLLLWFCALEMVLILYCCTAVLFGFSHALFSTLSVLVFVVFGSNNVICQCCGGEQASFYCNAGHHPTLCIIIALSQQLLSKLCKIAVDLWFMCQQTDFYLSPPNSWVKHCFRLCWLYGCDELVATFTNNALSSMGKYFISGNNASHQTVYVKTH